MNNEGIVVYSKKGDIIFTSTGEIKVVNKKPVRNNKNIINPIFEKLKCYNVNNNPEIDIFLSNASRNIFEKKYKYLNSILYKREYKKKTDIYINSNNLDKTYDLLEKFIIDNNSSSSSPTTDETINECVNKKIVNDIKNIDKDLFNSHVLYLKNKYNLSDNEALEIESLINVLFISEFISSDNVILNNKKIEQIKYLNFDVSKKTLIMEKHIIPKLLKKEVKKFVNKDLWDKKIEKFILHITKNQ